MLRQNASQPLQASATLTLAHGTSWAIAADGDAEASTLVDRLAEIMQLPRGGHADHRLLVSIGSKELMGRAHLKRLPSQDPNTHRCALLPSEGPLFPPVQLMTLSRFIARDAQDRGGLLLHGALAEWEGRGAILAGPGEVGKTTATRRLPPRWRACCDDTTLVVRDAQGGYWAHPWPTWSTYLNDHRATGTWDTQRPVRLRAVFFLEQSPQDEMRPLGQGEAVCALVESAKQAMWQTAHRRDPVEPQGLHEEGFRNGCALAQVVPMYCLHLSLTGSFWELMEQALTAEPGDRP